MTSSSPQAMDLPKRATLAERIVTCVGILSALPGLVVLVYLPFSQECLLLFPGLMMVSILSEVVWVIFVQYGPVMFSSSKLDSWSGVFRAIMFYLWPSSFAMFYVIFFVERPT